MTNIVIQNYRNRINHLFFQNIIKKKNQSIICMKYINS
nr:MAG TPA: hypothetical protein [Caudoviricetes sp.]